jgi:hypothetical protein
MMSVRFPLRALLACLLFATTARADVIDFSDLHYVSRGTFASSGLVDWDDGWTWNGAPRSDTNEPTDAQLRLKATVNFLIDPSQRNQLFVQLTDVVTTQGASWFNDAFDAVTQTGIRLTLPFFSDHRPTLDASFANPGQVSACCSFPEQVTPLSITPGYRLDFDGASLLIHTINGSDLGFTSLGNIRNATRIRGGGVFALTFDDDVNLLPASLWKDLLIENEYGAGRQYIDAVRQRGRPVAEPGTLTLLSLSAVFFLRRRRRVR